MFIFDIGIQQAMEKFYVLEWIWNKTHFMGDGEKVVQLDYTYSILIFGF